VSDAQDLIPGVERRKNQALLVEPFRESTWSLDSSNLRTCTIDKMVPGGSISLGMGQAVREIRNIYYSLTRTLETCTSNYEKIDFSRSDLDPAIPAQLREAYRDRYKPWVVDLRRVPPPPGQRPPPRYSVIINVVVFNARLDDIDRQFKRGCGFARRIVIDGLGRYAERAGWGVK